MVIRTADDNRLDSFIVGINHRKRSVTINPRAEITFYSFRNILELNEKGYKIVLHSSIIREILNNSKVVDQLSEDQIPVYGINTGFGQMINTIIPKEHTKLLQKNLILTHATGIGEILSFENTRQILLVRILNLAKGYSGLRIMTIMRMIVMFNHRIIPVIPSQGSLGASGDLAPLSHIVAAMYGKGFFWSSPITQIPANEAIEILGWTVEDNDKTNIDNNNNKFTLSEKEGLALINGTSAMTGIALNCNAIFHELFSWHLDITALTLAALNASEMPFHPKGNSEPIRKHHGQEEIASNIWSQLENCKLIEKHDSLVENLKNNMDFFKKYEFNTPMKTSIFLQKAYSLRCIPQVAGAVYDTWQYFKNTIIAELNSLTDNPIIIDDIIFHGANFHGQYIAFACDYLRIAVVQLAQLIDRRIAMLIDSHYSNLPDLLAYKNEGLECAFEGLQYSSTSVVAEMKGNVHPMSIQSIPSNLNNQDLVSCGMQSARYLYQAIKDLKTVIAVEGIMAAQAVELRMQRMGIDKSNCEEMREVLGPTIYQTFIRIRKHIDFLEKDKYLGNIIEKMQEAFKEKPEKEYII